MKKVSISVLCVCLFGILYSCKKSHKHPDYSAKMVGVRQWVGMTRYSRMAPNPPSFLDTGTRLIDTSFAVQTEGSDIVLFWGYSTKLYYTREDPAAKSVVYNYRPETPMDELSVEFTYFYERDSMTYYSSSWHHQYGWTTTMHTK